MMFETVFGSELPLAARFFIAFLVVLALIGLTAWLVRRFGAARLGGGNARGRQPRLAVIDAASVDGRRRLVLIRRDNVEHLLMIGGPTDVVVEQNIVRAAAATAREPARTDAPRTEPSLRSPPQAENGWPLQPANETVQSPPATPSARPYRASPTEEPWLAPEPGARPRPADSSSLAGLAVELSSRLNPPEQFTAPLRSEPPVRASAPPPPPPAPPVVAAEPAPQSDHNLAEMAHQLEAALRRAPMPETRPPLSDPLAVPLQKPADAPARDYKLRIDPKFDTRAEPKIDSRPPEIRPQPAAAAGKAAYESLEEEMANLLGRPSGKT